MRDASCPDCQQLTGGDCGKHTTTWYPFPPFCATCPATIPPAVCPGSGTVATDLQGMTMGTPMDSSIHPAGWWETRSRDAIGRLSDVRWDRVQKVRRWLLLGAELALVLGCAGGILAYVAVGVHVEAIKTDAARMRAEAAEIRLAVEYRRCEAFPNDCKLRQSVFYKRARTPLERQPARKGR